MKLDSSLEAAKILDLGGWCILRTASRDTLHVCDELRRAGVAAYAPRERRVGRMPRTRKQYDKTLALMPTYVFAPAERMDDLLALSIDPRTNCPPFTVFKYGDGFPLIADTELEALRAEEARRKAIFEKQINKGKKAPTFAAGLKVLLSDAGFKGIMGKVVESQGSFTLVDVPGFAQPIKIASLQLEKDVLASNA